MIPLSTTPLRPRSKAPGSLCEGVRRLALGVFGRSRLRQALALAVGGMMWGGLTAAVVTWDGGASTGAWGTGNNWSTNSVPANTDTLIFNATGANNQFNLTLGGNRTTGGITFASAAGTNAFTFSGNTLTVTGGGIVNNDGETQTFNSAVTASAAQTWNAAAGGLTFGAVTLGNNLTLAGANTITLGNGGGVLTLTGNRTLTNNATGAVNVGQVNLSNNTTARTLTITGTGDTNVTGVVGNGGATTGSLTKTGTGTLTLTGANTYSGTTTLTAGTVVVGSATAFGTSAVNFAAATLQGDGTSRTLANTLSLTGNGTVAGTSNLTFTGPLTLTGNRTLTINNTALTTFGNINLSNTTTARTLTITGTGDTNVTGVVGNGSATTGNLTKTGTGTLTLTGTNTYSGITRLNEGTLSVATIGNGGVAGNLGAATNAANRIVFAGGTLQYTGATASTNRNFTLTVATTSGIEVTGAGTNLTLSGASTATTGALTKTGAGTLTLSGANLHTGVTSVNAGTLAFGANNALSSGAVTVNGGTLAIGNFTDTVGAVTLTNGAITGGTGVLTGTSYAVENGTISAILGGAGALTKTTGGTVTLSGANTYTGATTVNAGLLQLNASNVIADASDVVIASGATLQFDWGALSETVGSLSGAGTLSLRNSSFTTDTAANTTFSGTITDSFGTFRKAGSGTLTLTGNSTYTGITAVDAGTLVVGSNTALGASTFGNTIASGATLGLQNGVTLNEGSFTVAGTGSGGVGAINNLSGGNTINATLTLGGATTFGSTAGTLNLTGTLNLDSNLTLTGAGAFNATGAINGVGGLTMAGPGTVTLSGGAANNLSGAVNINQGTVVLAKTAGTSALGQGTITIGDGIGAAGSAIVQLGANEQIVDFAPTVTIASDGRLDLNGNTESLNLLAGTGQVTLGSGSLALGVQSGSSAYGGVISGSGTLTKAGSGVLTLSGANTYTGATTVTAGTLRLGAANVLADTTAVTVNNGATFDLNNNSDTVGSIAGAGAITLGSGNLTAGGTNASTVFSGAISGTGALTKTGTGTLTLAGTNTYSGATTVAAGTLLAQGNAALGAAAGATTVSSGATLAIAGGTNLSKSGALTLSGTGTSSTTGALHAAGATGTISQWSGNLVLAGNTTITAADNILKVGNDLTFANTINLGANTLTLNATSATSIPTTYLFAPSYPIDPTNIYITSTISGTGGLTKTGPGTLTLISFPLNTYTGATTITGGTMIVDGSGALPTPGGARPVISGTSVIVGNAVGAGAADSVVLRMGQLASGTGPNYAIGSYDGTAGVNLATTSLTIYADGILQMQGAANAFTNLTLQGGHIDQGVPAQESLLSITGGITTLASSRTAVIQDGNLGLSNNAFAFNVAAGGAPGGIDLRIDSKVQNGIGFTGSAASNSFVKTGAGTLQLTAANIYGGITDVQAGVLNLAHGQALGQSTTGTNHGTVVQTGAQLQLQGGITVNTETLTLSGTGLGNTGALRNLANDNTYRGQIRLAADTRITADAGTTLAITNPNSLEGTIINGTAAGKNLTVGGAGDTIINGGLGGFVNNLTKDGTGTLILAGANGHVGATAVTSGAIKVIHNNALAGAGVTVSSGAALQFARTALGADLNATGPAITISGTGLANGGAIQNLTGNNTFVAPVTLAASSRITADAGSSLTFTNTVNGAGFAFNVGGAGNTTYNGAISGTSTAVTKSDTGTVTFGGTAANTFTGTLTVADGTLNLNKTAGVNAVGTGAVIIGDGAGAASSANLVLQAGNQIQDNAILTLNADGRLALGTFVESVGSIAGTGLVDLGTTGSLTVGANGASSSFSGSVTGTGTLEKSGAGSLTFNSDINYGGTFVLGGGTLLLNNVDLTVTNFIITANSTIDFGGGSSNIFATNLSLLNSGITVNIINWNNTIDFFFATNFAGATPDDRGGPSANQIVFSGYTGANTIWQSFDDQITPVPEPSTYGALLLAASLGLLGYRRWRQHRAAPAPLV